MLDEEEMRAGCDDTNESQQYSAFCTWRAPMAAIAGIHSLPRTVSYANRRFSQKHWH